MKTILKIRRLYFKEGVYQHKIARKLQLNHRTIEKYLNTISPATYYQKKQNHSKFGEFIPFLHTLLSQKLI